MTYIIAGRLNNLKFMMSDCIATDKGRKTFAVKLIKIVSSPDTYYALTGTSFIAQCIEILDHYFVTQGRRSDFCNGSDSIKVLDIFIQKAITAASHPSAEHPLKIEHLGDARLFFISKDNVCYYDLSFDKNNQLKYLPVAQQIPLGHYIDSYIDCGIEELKGDLVDNNLEDYCLKHISKMALDNGGEDFRDRFSFVVFDENTELTKKYGFNHPSDTIAWFYRITTDMLDDKSLVFDLK